MGGVQYLVAARLGLWNVGAFAGGMGGLLIGLLLSRGKATQKGSDGNAPRRGALAITFSAYWLLILFTVFVLLIPPIKAALALPTIRFAIPQTTTLQGYVTPAGHSKAIHIFAHAGAILLYTSLLAYLVYRKSGRYQPGAAQRILHSTLKNVIKSSLSILSMVAMAVVMQQNGMTDALARGLANAFGRAYPVIAPWIGAIGAFMTGSNTNSNVVFAALQMRTAELLGYAAPIILAAQTAAAAVASVAAPTKVVVGASTAGLAGKEGEVLRALLAYTLALVGFITLLTILFIWVL
jgi:lactate permease